jgi:glycosyltransferase involved in cell wall biosynthesis
VIIKVSAKIVFMLDYKGDDLQIGGTSNYLKLLAPRVRNAGFDVRVAMPVSPRTEDLKIALEDSGIPVDDIDTSPQGGSVLRRFYVVFRHLSMLRPSVAHFMMPWWNACEYGVYAAWLARVPARVATYHAVPSVIDSKVYKGLAGVARRYRHRHTFGRVQKAIAVSEKNRRRLLANGLYRSEQVVVIRNGVDVNEFAPIDGYVDYRYEWGVEKSSVLITLVGYLEEIKGHRYLLQALPDVLRRHSNVVVAFVGDGVLRTSLEAYVRENNLSDHVIFAGWHEDVHRILAVSDILVLPSISEGMPLVVLEAMAAGLPVVATRVGGIPEAVIEGKTGLLVEPASAHGLQDAIVKMLQDPERMRDMGKAGQARAWAEFDVERMVDETCEVYRNLLRNSSN